MVLIKLLCTILDSRGLEYTLHDGTVQLIMNAGARSWNAAFTADDKGFLRYYARYPMRVAIEKTGIVLAALNRLNGTLRAGCFLISDGYPVFRYSAYIFDEFTAAEATADLITVASAMTAAAWDDIQNAVRM